MKVLNYSKREIITRKDHKCESCGKLIPKGSKVVRHKVYPQGKHRGDSYYGVVNIMSFYFCGPVKCL